MVIQGCYKLQAIYYYIEQPYLGDLVTMVINHLLNGMILQVRSLSPSVEKTKVNCQGRCIQTRIRTTRTQVGFMRGVGMQQSRCWWFFGAFFSWEPPLIRPAISWGCKGWHWRVPLNSHVINKHIRASPSGFIEICPTFFRLKMTELFG